MTASTAVALMPASLDPRIPRLNDFGTYFGIRVADIGEDGDLIALGHHPPKAALAAFNAHARKVWGLLDLLDGGRGGGPAWRRALDDVKPRWAVLLTNRCRDCTKNAVVDGCVYCSDVRAVTNSGSWWIAQDAAHDEPGAFPVTCWRA
jgi:hypothetical protein